MRAINGIVALGFAGLLGALGTEAAFSFKVDIKTVAEARGTVGESPVAARLFMNGSLSEAARAPLGTTLWFVADRNRDGVPTAPGSPSEILGPDDLLVHVDVVNGGPPAKTPGVYRLVGLTLTEDERLHEITSAHLYVYLWNGLGTTFTPVVGSTFGLGTLGTTSLPPIGNGFWGLDENIIADQYYVVPEPAALGVLWGGSLIGWVAFRRTHLKR